MNKDIKYLGVPNVCFSLVKKDDYRESLYQSQREERGFDDSELWSLRDTIANFIIPRLEIYQEQAKNLDRDDELVNEIDDFLSALKLVARDKGTLVLTKEERLLVQEGLEKFPKIFLSLWY